MSLRSKILALYVALALIPMMVVSVGNYAQAVNSLSGLVHTKLDAASEQGALGINLRSEALTNSLKELTQPRFTDVVYGSDASLRPVSDRDLAGLWPVLDPAFESVEFHGAGGEEIAIAVSPTARAGTAVGNCTKLIEFRAVIPEGNGERGTVIGRVHADALLPETQRGWYGRNGQRLLVNGESEEVVFDARCSAGYEDTARPPVAQWLESDTGAGRGRVTFRESGMEKVGSYAKAAGTPWIVVSVADMEEFTGPYRREQLAYLVFVMFIVIAAGGAFLILAQQVMSSLEELTKASEQIGEGHLTPWLPPPGPDEVGRLSLAFSTMLGRLKTMMRQNEVARRLAVAGDVAAQLSHEIRNPLSSIRLNLQSLARETKAGHVPSDLPQVVRLCLREIDRLDEAVGSVLELGQPREPELSRCRLGEVAQQAVDVLAQRMGARGITVHVSEHAQSDWIDGDEGQLRGVLLNLLLNAVDAMPEGGTLRVWTAAGSGPAGDEVRLHIADSGEGVRPELRQLVFEPFFTTKAGGSGIGLSIALQVVGAHDGRLYLADDGEGPGAEFIVALPAPPVEESAPGRDGDPASNATEGGPWRPGRGGVERVEA